jgi:hypothetical protein
MDWNCRYIYQCHIVMKNRNRVNTLVASLLVLTVLNTVAADNVRILAADFHNSGGDNWRGVDGDGNILGDRVLFHPHVDEQPFTRCLGDVEVPVGTTTVYIEAHDKVHGWAPSRLNVDLSKVSGGHLNVEVK